MDIETKHDLCDYWELPRRCASISLHPRAAAYDAANSPTALPSRMLRWQHSYTSDSAGSAACFEVPGTEPGHPERDARPPGRGGYCDGCATWAAQRGALSGTRQLFLVPTRTYLRENTCPEHYGTDND